jgi:acetyl esterase
VKKRHVAAGIALLALVGLAALTWRWTFTPHGRLDWRAALSLHLLSFDYTFRPDPDVDFELTLPINLLYPLSGLLPAEEVEGVEDVSIPTAEGSLSARVYRPVGVEGDAPPPALVYYHGGGFVVGSVEIFDPLARSLANATSSVVVSVEYRLAPAHPYPAAIDDAYAALEWVGANAADLGADPARLLVGGDSAGGNLAAVMALRARDEGGPRLAGQLLYYPATDNSGHEYASVADFADGYGLSRQAGRGFVQAYAGHVQERRDPYLSPLHAPSHAGLPPALVVTAGLPPALVVTAGFDPLTDSALAYVEALRRDGVAVEHAHDPTVFHGFLSIRFFPQRGEALARTTRFLREHLAGETPVAASIHSRDEAPGAS